MATPMMAPGSPNERSLLFTRSRGERPVAWLDEGEVVLSAFLDMVISLVWLMVATRVAATRGVTGFHPQGFADF